MKTALLFSFLLSWLSLAPVAAAAAVPLPPSEVVPSRAFQVKYQVPAHWTVTRQRTDSVEVLRYHSPDNDALLWVGQLRGRHAQLTPAQAMRRVLRHQLHPLHHEEHHVSSHGLDFLESTGTYRVNGRLLRYDARVTRHQGHVLVVYLYASTAAFAAQAPLLHQVLDSAAPLRGK
jgi:hypothetical protein